MSEKLHFPLLRHAEMCQSESPKINQILTGVVVLGLKTMTQNQARSPAVTKIDDRTGCQ